MTVFVNAPTVNQPAQEVPRLDPTATLIAQMDTEDRCAACARRATLTTRMFMRVSTALEPPWGPASARAWSSSW